MEYRVLGKLDVRRDGESIDLGAYRQRSLLALLLTSPNAVFSTDQLIDGLWGDDGSPDRQNSLWVYISGIRKALEPDRQKRSEGSILLTRAPGYVLNTEPDEVDAVHFEKLVVEGQALAHTDPAAASLVLGEALAMWRGRPFEDFTYESFAQAEISRLEALRVEAVESRIDADLDRGLSRELVSELETLVRQHPLQERLTGQLMVALYRSGRQADALRSYQTLRARLGEELGLEPGGAIQRLEAQMIAGDAALDGGYTQRPAVGPPQSGMAVRGYELREVIRRDDWGTTYRAYQPAVGREVAISVISPELADDPDFIRSFEAEAQLAARLEHPHIVPLHDFWREPGAAYVVTRLMSGGSLAEALDRGGLTPEQATAVIQHVGTAVQVAQRASVRLPALTPDNIVLDDEANAYISNVGIAALDPASARGESELIAELGVTVARAISGLDGEMVQVRGALSPFVREVLDRATTFGDAPSYPDIGAFAAEMRDAVGLSDVTSTEDEDLDNPYKGLRSFEAGDAANFFGRERLIERLVARLGESGTRGRFVTLVGPSGSGKSSVVKAGLLPALRKDALPLSASWFTVSMTPAPHPFEELEDALRSIAIEPPASLVELISAENGLHRAVARVMPQDATQLLLVIDQFEELFTQVDENTATAFLDVLAAAVNHPQSRLRVVVTLRADFYDRPLRHRAIGELLREGTEAITPMTPEELERAIAGPAETLGVSVEPTLMAELVTDVVDRPGALPLLQYTLTELFDGRSGRRMTAEHYRSIGGMSGALVDRADGLLARLGAQAHDATRQIFLRLVTLGEGADDTRRRVLRSELEQLAVDRQTLAGVLDTFGRHRLLSFDRDPVTRGPTVEISHEALLSEWGQLRDWIDGARDDVRNQRRLAEAMSEWAAAGRSDDYLLRGGRLEQLHGWAATTSLPLSDPEQSFLAASVDERERLEGEEEERERRAAVAEQRASTRARQLAGAGAIGVLVAALAVFGIWQWRSAEDGRSEAETAREQAESARSEAESARAATELAKADGDHLVLAAELVTASEASLDDDPERALLLAAAAVRETSSLGYATEDAVDAVHWALQRLGVQYPVGADAAFAVRSGPVGLAGVFVIPPADLVALAEDATTRRLTDDECEVSLGRPCPEFREMPAGTPLRFGAENYGVVIPEVLAESPNFAAGPLAGTRVSFAASSALASADGLEAELRRFTELTGIEITIVPNEDFQATTALTAGTVANFPDLAMSYYLPEAWAQPRVLDLAQFLDTDALRADFGDYLIDLAMREVDGTTELQTIPTMGVAKDLVFYAKPAFEEAGYEIPKTWDGLVELANTMVSDGRTPFCFQWEAGFASGFVGSDFFEAVLLRSAGMDVYDDVTSGELSFANTEVVAAAKRAEEILFSSGFIRGGVESITSEVWGTPMGHLLETNSFTGTAGPQCMMVIHQGQMVELLGAETGFGSPGRLGVDVDVFPLPQMRAEGPVVVAGGGNLTAGLTDRPEVRALLRYIASPQWGEVWAQTEAFDAFFSLNQRFDTAAYEGERQMADFEVRKRIHEVSRAALAAETWRYDLSDQMPAGFGVWTEDFRPGAIWQGMLDWVDQRKPIDEILTDIEAQRPRE